MATARWGEGTDPSAEIGTGRAEPALYRDPERLRAERERIFQRTWLVADRVESLPNPGDFLVWERIGQFPLRIPWGFVQCPYADLELERRL